MGDLCSNLVTSFLLLFFLACVANAGNSNGIFNVHDYGAVADGRTDNAKAFEKAWGVACAAAGRAQILIPAGSYLVGPVAFKGPCKGAMAVQLEGRLQAVTDLSAYSSDWILFQYVNGLTISGGGKIDGQGASAWPHNQCPQTWNCKLQPISLVIADVDGATISGISFIDSKFFHINIFGSKNIVVDSITITAPADSPNTDGIHISGSSNVTVTNSIIGTGDDCVSIGPSTTGVTITNVQCGPGHGISVGSLGKNANEGDVVGLTVRNCTLTGTSNGVRIKTWQSSPVTTSASNFTYEDIVMNSVENPIIIDQKYCPYKSCSESAPSRVKISHIKFQNIRGTSASPVAVSLLCSDAWPCDDVQLSDVNIEYTGGKAASASCVNVKGSSNGNVKPPSCI